MPCSGLPRGIATPASIPPFTGTPLVNPPYNNAVQNNPCGNPFVTNAGGTAYADGLCLLHLMFKYGQAAISPPYVFSP